MRWRNGVVKRLICVGLVVSFIVSPIQIGAKYTPEDTYWDDDPETEEIDEDKQWGPEQIFADYAWDLTDEENLTNPGSNNIIIAIIDRGINIDHEDLTNVSIWKNPEEEIGDSNNDHYPGVQGDDDNDGTVDFNDSQIRVRDYNNNGMALYGPDPLDPENPGDGIADGFWNTSLNGGLGGWDFPPGSDDDPGDYDFATKDDNENGLLDDINGWNWHGNNNSINEIGQYDAGTNKTDYHGSHVAGITAATIDNYGIAGMAQVELMILVHDTFYDTKWEAIRYAIDNGADVISTSWGYQYGFLHPPGCYDALALEARNNNILWVSASGNERNLTEVNYPAYNPYVVSVGASYKEGINDFQHRPDYSNGGPNLDIIAPAGSTAQFKQTTIFSTFGPNSSDYNLMAGTSISTPHVAAIAALIMTYRPSFSPERISKILNATTIDITDEPGPRYDNISSRGKDNATGWGEVNSYQALGYANYLRNRWSDSIDVRQNKVVEGEWNQPSLCVDSEGYTHIVWIDNSNSVNETFYASVDPAGRIFCNPKSVETQALRQSVSKYPDIYVDQTDTIHISWLEVVQENQRDDIYYSKLSAQGTVINGPIQVTNSGTPKEYLNILADTGSTPQPKIVYAQDTSGNWDIYKVEYDNYQSIWLNPSVIINDGKEQRKPSADVGEYGNSDYLYIAFQQRANPTSDWEIWMWNNYSAPTSWRLTDDSIDDINPNLCILHQQMLVYVVWTKENAIDKRDKILLVGIDGKSNNHQSITYGSTPGSNNTHIQVGHDSNNTTPYDVKGFPKVSVSEISNSSNRDNSSDFYQINVIWRERTFPNTDWGIYYSELTVDGRNLTDGSQQYLVDCGVGFPQIASSQIRSSERINNWFDRDGNFRVLHYQSYIAGVNHLWYLSTRERWGDRAHVGDNNGTEINLDLTIDDNNGLHIVYESRTTKGRIYYRCWLNGGRPGSNSSSVGPIAISDVNHNCIDPKITTIMNGTTVEAIIIYKDMSLRDNTGEFWFYRLDSTTGQMIRNERLKCTSPDYDIEYGHSIVNDYKHDRIGVVWYEDLPPPLKMEIAFGVVDYNNRCKRAEILTAVEGSSHDDVNPAMDVDLLGNFHIVYHRWDGDIYYNVVEKSTGYYKVYQHDIHVDDSSVPMYSRYPAICIDKVIHRRSENKKEHENISTSNRFIHITYTRKDIENIRWMLWYTKLNSNGKIVVKEKDILRLEDNRSIYYSDDPIISTIDVNEDNQLGIVYHGKMHRGTHWPQMYSHYNLFFIKLDNNGEILTQETLVSQEYNRDSKHPAIEYDRKGRLSVVWEHNDLYMGWEASHCWEMEQKK
jgi:hypothetical protein